VQRQVALAQKGAGGGSWKRVLVVGSSTGYGLSSLISAVFGYGADAVGLCFERAPQGERPGSAGWYNLAEVARLARAAGRKVVTLNGDAFAAQAKDDAVAALKELGGPVDMVIYSLASPRRVDTDGKIWNSVLKPLHGTYKSKSIDLNRDVLSEVTIEPASPEDVEATIKVMGGEDWQAWMDRLAAEKLLAPGCRTISYSYIGPELTHPIYTHGTIGQAKAHLDRTARGLNATLAETGGGAWVSVNKALVTQASSAIPVVPLYISLLYKVMKEKGTHEGTIEQIVRLFRDRVGPGRTPPVDEQGRIRMDDWEMAADVQATVARLWPSITTENLLTATDYDSFKQEFRSLFGFEVPGIDYSVPVELDASL
jgi:enoyl-[acyl-carrier protein] reductase/trans-2-enoyl-CoA reductase (NAD+)